MSCQNIYLTIKNILSVQANNRASGRFGNGLAEFDYSQSDIDSLRNELLSLNIRKKDCVALVISDRINTLISFLAVSSSSACAPLNPSYTLNEYKFFLSDLKPRAIITDQKDSPAVLAAKLLKIRIIYLSTNKAKDKISVKRKQKEKKSVIYSSLDDIALILHTSGTTNKPKMVPLTHRNIMASIKNISETFKLSEQDTCLNLVPIYHVHGLIASLAALSSGGCLYCTPYDNETFFDLLRDFKPTWYTAVPAIHRAIITRAKENKFPPKNKLRFIRSSSSPLSAKIALELEKIFKAPVSESYGMTEAALQITANPLPPEKRKLGSAGKPFGLKIGIIGDNNKFLPPENSGEIVIKGKNVFSGYKNNPLANNKSLYKGWFRTGDSGYLDSDGFLFINGRIKDIINRGGEKISPREIDEVFLKHPGVEDALAFAIPHPALGEDIATAVILKNNAKLKEETLKKFVSKELADFKIPSRIIIVKQFPTGPGGKLKRSGCYEMFKHMLISEYKKPISEIEKILTKIWQKVLHINQIGINDNFFELGGDSLKMGELLARITKNGWSVSVADLLNMPTVNHLIKIIKKKEKNA